VIFRLTTLFTVVLALMPSAAMAQVLERSDAFTVPFEELWAPWTGDLDGMIERRVIRAVVPYGGYQFYYEDGEPKGAVWELLKRLEDHLNEKLGRRNIRVYVTAVPMNRDQFLPALLNGNADLVAADLTTTESRSELVDFTRPLLTDIDEIVVTGPAAKPLDSLDDLAGMPIFVRASSSYYDHLLALGLDFRERGLEPPKVVVANELLEAHDILEMVDTGIVTATVVDDYKAEFWNEVFPDITLHHDLVVHSGSETSWAFRKNSPEFAELMKGFMRKYGKGSLVGNDTYARYLSRVQRIRCSGDLRMSPELERIANAFRASAEEFDFDWLMLAAQGFQESKLRQNRKSPAGAVGIMQIKPSTAADKNVNIPDISSIENNVRAGSKYMRFIVDRYFADSGMDELNQWLFALAAYNAGPARVTRLRNEARNEGRDPNVWFDSVEIVAGRRIGRETVTYVSNVFKYFIGYQLAEERVVSVQREFRDVLTDCSIPDETS
jgi:membrane-bound lytic murein transglycosylase MltF